MALRLIEIVLHEPDAGPVQKLLEEQQILGVWEGNRTEERNLVRVLLDSQHTEAALDAVEAYLATARDHRVLVFPLEATLPRPPDPEKQASEAQAAEIGKETQDQSNTSGGTPGRISREEIYEDANEAAALSWAYLVMTLLSALVAGIGLTRDDVAIIIGAMVIAPLLGPNMALALATTLGDVELIRQSLKANALGLSAAFVLSLVLGSIVSVDPTVRAIASRTDVSLSNILLALAAGSAGALAFSRGGPTALIGVMVAVALLPPLAATGLLAGSGYGRLALGAALLVLTNLICINLAGVVTFLVQGIRPRTWWEADRAKKATRVAISLWVLLLAALVLLTTVRGGD